MRPTKILQWVFVAGCGIWGALLAGGRDNGFTSIWTWIVAAVAIVAGLAVAVAIVLWVMKALGVIANLPWTLERKLNDDGQS